MATQQRKSPNPAQMTLAEVAFAIGMRPDSIKHIRRKEGRHQFFDLAFKTGTGTNSPLRWWRKDVDEYLREKAGHGIDGES